MPPPSDINSVSQSDTQLASGINTSREANLQTSSNINGLIRPLPPKIEPSGANIGNITNQLMDRLRMRHEYLKRVARVLIHIYNGGGGTMKELAKVGGYPHK